jgi:hypothetical protein
VELSFRGAADDTREASAHDGGTLHGHPITYLDLPQAELREQSFIVQSYKGPVSELIHKTVVLVLRGAFDDKKTPRFRNPSRLPTGFEDLIIYAKVYSLADKYFVKGLKEITCEKFELRMRDYFTGRICTMQAGSSSPPH